MVDGLTFQITSSVTSYSVMAIASIFDQDIRNDMNAIGWNPFNSNANIVGDSKKVSFYKGVPVFRTNGSSMSLGLILLSTQTFTGSSGHKWTSTETIKHEWGHNVQLWSMGLPLYLLNIALPSAVINNEDDAPWEITADLLGGVNRKFDSTSLNKGWNYYWWGRVIGPFWWW